jgi:uncharacterized membrane protein YgcG
MACAARLKPRPFKTMPEPSFSAAYEATPLRKLVLKSLVIPVLLLAALPAWASWRISNFRTTMDVSKNGSAVVAERITLVFIGTYHGIHRTIPIDYPGPSGTNYTLFLNVTGVKDGEGNALKYELSRRGHYRDIKIYIPGAVDTTKTVEIDYEVKNPVRYFPDHDELYWNVTGNDWPVPIDYASALVMFPSSAAGELRAQAFTGVYGATEQGASTRVNGSSVEFETNNPLPMRGGLTVDVFLPKGILEEPSRFTRTLWFLESNSIVLLPVAALVVMFVLWYSVGRDPNPGMSVAPMYEPPKSMTPAEVGTLVDDAVNPRDITCTLVDLAVKGFLKIEEVKEKHLLFSDRDYILHLLKPRDQWSGLAAHERVMLDNIFGGGEQQVALSSLKNHFYTAIPRIKDDIIYELKQKGMYTVDPESAHGYDALGIAILIALLVILHFAIGWSPFESAWSIVAIAVSAVIVWLFARKMTAKSLQGARTYVQILGFQDFMNRVDADRLKRMPPDTFEKYLPYAMALGVEHRWAHAFQGIIQNPPTWYAGADGYMFNPILFTNNMAFMASQAGSVFVSAPRASSTGSGFGGGFGGGGGGFSGGGFGGGGGGAF